MDRFDEVKERVKESADLVAVIEGYGVPLRQAGRNMVGLCPFHQEKTPSFTVYRDTQHFHCYGCGKAGDVFHFVMVKAAKAAKGATLFNRPPEPPERYVFETPFIVFGSHRGGSPMHIPARVGEFPQQNDARGGEHVDPSAPGPLACQLLCLPTVADQNRFQRG